MKLLIVPSWYPTNIHPESGTFFRDRAKILQRRGFSITIATHILHSTRDILKFKHNVNNAYPKVDDGVVWIIIYIHNRRKNYVGSNG